MDLFRGLLQCTYNMAAGSPRTGDPGGWWEVRERERENELEQRGSHKSFNDLDLEVTHFSHLPHAVHYK